MVNKFLCEKGILLQKGKKKSVQKQRCVGGGQGGGGRLASGNKPRVPQRKQRRVVAVTVKVPAQVSTQVHLCK